MKKYILPFMILLQLSISADCAKMRGSVIHILKAENTTPTFVNSVDFHPTDNRFCVTFTHQNSLLIFQLSQTHQASVMQILQGASSGLSYPQHALFSKDGRYILVSNWLSQTFTIYQIDENGLYQETPIARLPFFSSSGNFRPHGMTLSPDGNYLAVSYGASKLDPRAVALYQISDLGTSRVHFQLLSLLQDEEIQQGIPKGITFSPDSSCLLITLSETNSIAVYPIDWLHKKILPTPKQVIRGPLSHLSRPEDIKFMRNGTACVVSNSYADTVTVYWFDPDNNIFMNDSPIYMIASPEADLCFPHGLAFSADGQYLAITQFGPVVFGQDGNLSSWGSERKESVIIYKLQSCNQ